MYLSRLVLSPTNRSVWRDLANCHALHRTVMSGFPNLSADSDARARLGVLYRLEPRQRRAGDTLLVQSAIEPSWSRLPEGYLFDAPDTGENPDSKSLDPLLDALHTELWLRFRLRANPTKRVSKHATGEGRSAVGKRVELYREEDQLSWLAGKAERGGFALLAVQTDSRSRLDASVPAELASRPVMDVRASPARKVTGVRPGGAKMTFGAVTFDGLLRITDVERFREALVQGIGPAKAYGFGLLSIAPANAGSMGQ